MYELVRMKSFLKDYQKRKFSDQHYSKFVVVLNKLLNDEVLSDEYKDHSLKGNWSGYRELHISGDLLLIYKKTDTQLRLVRIGSHSQLF